MVTTPKTMTPPPVPMAPAPRAEGADPLATRNYGADRLATMGGPNPAPPETNASLDARQKAERAEREKQKPPEPFTPIKG